MKVLPPWLIDVRVREAGSRGFRIWVPLVVLWPLMLVLGLIALFVSVIVDAVRVLAFRRNHHCTALLLGCYFTANEARGTLVDVRGKDGSIVHVAIS